MKPKLLLGIALLLLSGCSKKFCEHEAEYEGAREYPSLSAPAGMEVPQADPTMQIPQARGNEQAVVNESRPCLELPPRIRSSS